MFYTRGLKQAPRMPYVVRENVLAAPGAFWEFSNNWHLRYLVHSLVFKSARLACEQVFLNERRDG